MQHTVIGHQQPNINNQTSTNKHQQPNKQKVNNGKRKDGQDCGQAAAIIDIQRSTH